MSGVPNQKREEFRKMKQNKMKQRQKNQKRKKLRRRKQKKKDFLEIQIKNL